MGTDIHGCVEVYIDGYWKCFIDIEEVTGRNYKFFGVFFDVRGDASLSFARRGMPEDISWRAQTKFCSECDGNGHREANNQRKARFISNYPSISRQHTFCPECSHWHSVSYLTMQEINDNYDALMDCIKDDKQTVFLFDTMHMLSVYAQKNFEIQKMRIGEDLSDVRLIVWFDS